MEMKVAILDLDNTIVDGESQKSLIKYLYRNGYVNFLIAAKIYFWFILYKLNLVTKPEKIMRLAFSFLKERKLTDFKNILHSYFESELKNKIFPEAIKIIDEHKKEGHRVIIISNAIKLLVEEVSDFLGADDCLGSQIETANGVFTGEMLGKPMYGKNKVEELKKYFISRKMDSIETWAYSDHHSDLELLAFSSHPIVINPNKILASIAKDRNWPSYNFIKR